MRERILIGAVILFAGVLFATHWLTTQPDPFMEDWS